MSLVRFGEDGSDIYIYNDVRFGLYCCACPIHDNPDDPYAGKGFGTDKDKLLLHVNKHIDAGHSVPSWLMHEIRTYELD